MGRSYRLPSITIFAETGLRIGIEAICHGRGGPNSEGGGRVAHTALRPALVTRVTLHRWRTCCVPEALQTEQVQVVAAAARLR
jgi:hypothetical protein